MDAEAIECAKYDGKFSTLGAILRHFLMFCVIIHRIARIFGQLATNSTFFR